MFLIRMGVPEMEEFWDMLEKKVEEGSATRDENKLYRKIGTKLHLLSMNPRYAGLNSHEISSLTSRYGRKVWESYLENRTPAEGRSFEVTILSFPNMCYNSLALINVIFITSI